MLRSKTLQISGWGNYPVGEAEAYRPERVREAREVVASAPQQTVISRGMGRSYGDACMNTGEGVILHERLNRFLGFDERTGVLEAEAGVSLAEILGVVVPRGWFLPVTPGTKFVSLGG